jgi:DUF438 domain-containing protein
VIDQDELASLFAGLRAVITVADENGRIIYLNDLAIEHYSDRGGDRLLGTNLRDCHSPDSQKKIKDIYARHRAGDLVPTRYYKAKDDGHAESIVLIPLVIEGAFRGVAEVMWTERSDLVFET